MQLYKQISQAHGFMKALQNHRVYGSFSLLLFLSYCKLFLIFLQDYAV